MEYTFTNSFQSDDEIINGTTYAFSLDMNTLLGNSRTNKRAEKFQSGELSRPPKCQNAFILYRKDKMASPEFKDRPAEDRRACDVSKEIKALWNREPEHIKSLFRALARKAEQIHSENYRQETEILEPEEQIYTIDQAFTEQFQHIQDNNMQDLFDINTRQIYILSNSNLNFCEPIIFEYYSSEIGIAQQAHDYPSMVGENGTAQETITAAQQEYYYPSWDGRVETAQETHDLIVTAAQQEYYYPSRDGRDETAQETHDLIVTAAQQEYYCPSGDGRNKTAQETHDLIVTAAQQEYYCPSRDGRDGTAQETHDLIVTATQQGYYCPFEDGRYETAQETHDLIVTATQQGYYCPFEDGRYETAQETHDLIVTATQQGYYCPFEDGRYETAQETHDLIVTATQQGYYCPFGDGRYETAQETHDLIVTAAPHALLRLNQFN
uniref:MATA-HMG n=2 Tax=Rhizophagus irregularis TaxID=588596 RepID=A0A1B1EVL4_9GLOM|nr:MATA-HMG [Rhizophagus irregularis]